MPKPKRIPADLDQYRAVSAEQAATNERARQLAYAAMPANRVRGLAVAASTLFTQYHSPSQLSATVARIQRATGRQFTMHTQRCLGDGSVEGVLVTRVK